MPGARTPSNDANRLVDRLSQWIDQAVVIDCAHPYVAIGRLVGVTGEYLELAEADMHDLRDTTTTREVYIVKTARHGIGVNRRVLLFRMEQVVGISLLADVRDD